MNEEEWRAQREQEMRAKTDDSKGAEEQKARMAQQLDLVLTKVLTPEAKQRLANVRLINEEKYLTVAQGLLGMVQQGQIKGKVTDEQIKRLLIQLTPKKNMTITRK